MRDGLVAHERAVAGRGSDVRRVLAHAIVLAGLAALVAAAFAAVVLARGRPPTHSEWGLLGAERRGGGGLRAVAGAAAAPPASVRDPARGRSTAAGTLTSCARSAAGSRARSRSTSCCFSWPRRSAARWRSTLPRCGRTPTGCSSGSPRIRTAMAAASTLTPTEQSLVARAGVSGDGWIGVWLPGLSREGALRVAPIVERGRAARPDRRRTPGAASRSTSPTTACSPSSHASSG